MQHMPGKFICMSRLRMTLFAELDCTDYYVRNLSVCILQEEYSDGEEVGKMVCKHYYHFSCIKNWLRQKNWCPICKSVALNTN